MGVRRKITPETRKIEGEFLKRKIEERGKSQVWVADQIPNISPALVGHWCGAFSPIPDIDLLQLGELLDFNAFELRPSLLDYAKYFELGAVLASLPKPARDQILWILDVAQKPERPHFEEVFPIKQKSPSHPKRRSAD